ncbi:MAG: aldo/keto reductase, partial [Oscillospiraceae bacterium]|nr:aldo/keto reductase [Oscillospiraceae bacterium]
RAILDKNNVKLECWYPLGHGNVELLNNSVITELAQKYGKDAGQIILRFEVQEGFITLPKSSTPERIKNNINIFDFTLTDKEMNSIRALDTGKTSHDPDATGIGETLLKAFVVED